MFNKTTLTVLGSALIMGSALASAPQSNFSNRNALGSRLTDQLEMNGTAITSAQKVDKNRRLAPAKAPATVITPVLTSVEGTNKVYKKTCGGFYLYYGDTLGRYDAEDMNAEIVYGENDKVYFKNILATATSTNSYVIGHREGNTVTVELPQTIMWVDNDPNYDPYGINVELLAYYVDPDTGALYYYRYDEKTSITYTINADGTIDMEDLGEDLMLAYTYTDDGSFCGYGDFYQTYIPTDLNINSIPENVKMEKYFCKMSGFGYMVNVGFDNDKLYIQGLTEEMPSSVVVADLNGNKGFIAQDQNVGIFEAYVISLKCGYPNPAYDLSDPDNTEERFIYTDGDFEINVDRENKVITCGSANTFMIFVAEIIDNYLYPVFAVYDFKLHEFTSFEGTPSVPYDLNYFDISEMVGYNSFIFKLSNLSQEGNLLDEDCLYYRIFVNNIVFKFINSGGAYVGIPEGETWTELPFNLRNENDIYRWDDLQREICFYFGGMTTVGAQSIYKYGDKVTYSDVATLDIETGVVTVAPYDESAVKTINTNNGEAEYFDLNGVRVNNPEKGIFVKRSISADGKPVVEKIVK